MDRRTLAEILAEAEAKISRLSPAETQRAMENGALLIDIRQDRHRARDGIVPGSLHIPRTVLEWRTAPDGEFRNPYVVSLDQEIILICDHGCSTILAAAILRDFGYRRAGDVIGGFADWRAAGLPVGTAPAPSDHPDGRSGMGPPDP